MAVFNFKKGIFENSLRLKIIEVEIFMWQDHIDEKEYFNKYMCIFPCPVASDYWFWRGNESF